MLFKNYNLVVNHKKIASLMRKMGIAAIYPKPNTSKGHPEHTIYPYLLRNLRISHTNQVWSTDITYIPMKKGFLYLVAIIDWYSRYIISWEISNTLNTVFCIDALNTAFATGYLPKFFNTDQGSQFTSKDFIKILADKEAIKISMDGKGRAIDNVYIERFWRTLKYEEVYINGYSTTKEAILGIKNYINYYNNKRPHQHLHYSTPAEIYHKIISPNTSLSFINSQASGRITS